MNRERRKGQAPIPSNLREILSLDQKLALKELENFGWEIDFVRRPLFQEPRVFVRNPTTGKLSVIEADGAVDHNPIDITPRQGDQ